MLVFTSSGSPAVSPIGGLGADIFQTIETIIDP
jgi:hypothetical protein